MQIRKLELCISVLVFLMTACYFGEVSSVKLPAAEVMKACLSQDCRAILPPEMPFPSWAQLVSAFSTGALREDATKTLTFAGTTCFCIQHWFLLESSFALFVALLINLAVVSVSGTLSVTKLCINTAANFNPKLCSRCIFTEYAGQIKLHHPWNLFIGLLSKLFNLSLLVAIIGGTAGRLIIIASMILSYELPLALVPLKFSSSTTKMGPHKNSIYIIVVSWVIGLGVIGINVYYLSTNFVTWIIHSSFSKPVTVLIGVVV
ncbi:metal transporter Nramp5-like [Zingiber officinale]|uniref:metal transporter Nramp5-like n=1 Tax=Zingiber officinale TaxID=94328 RepID=UPI001C4C0B06|nr:metal transporter Nramp5-like [Zingiber officinale]